jgi:hypothetical protein
VEIAKNVGVLCRRDEERPGRAPRTEIVKLGEKLRRDVLATLRI